MFPVESRPDEIPVSFPGLASGAIGVVSDPAFTPPGLSTEATPSTSPAPSSASFALFGVVVARGLPWTGVVDPAGIGVADVEMNERGVGVVAHPDIAEGSTEIARAFRSGPRGW